MKKTLGLSLVVIMIFSMGVGVFADEYKTPAEIYSGLTGVTLEEAYQLRSEGKTYGELADEKGLLKEFEDEFLESKTAILELRVTEGRITRERADSILKIWADNDCDEPGQYKLGRNAGLMFGNGNGQGSGTGLRDGSGRGFGNGNGMKNRDLSDGTHEGFGNRWNQQ